MDDHAPSASRAETFAREAYVAPVRPPRAAIRQGTKPVDARARRGVVLILSDIGNEQFDQLASSLRRHGIAVTRIQLGKELERNLPTRARTRWLRDKWLYDGCVRLDELAHGLPASLAGREVLDAMMNEPTVVAVGLHDPAIGTLVRHSLAFVRNGPELLLDKFAVNAFLERHSVPIPTQISATELTPAEAVARLGLPLIIKARNGAAGIGVRLAKTAEAVQEAVRELGRGDPGNVFYQQYVDGEMVMYGTVFGENGPLIEHGIKVVTAQWDLGPSADVQLFDEPGLLEAGRRAMRAMGCQGFAEIGFIRDRAGRYWHIDANLRSWGNMISLLSAGVDYVGAYAALLTGAPYVEPRLTGETDASVLPFKLYHAINYGSRRDIATELRRFTTVCRHGPGLRYGAVISLKTMYLLLKRGLREAAAAVRLRRRR